MKNVDYKILQILKYLPLLVSKRGMFSASGVAVGGSGPAGEESNGVHDSGRGIQWRADVAATVGRRIGWRGDAADGKRLRRQGKRMPWWRARVTPPYWVGKRYF
jgi:hypothetical protein